MKNNSEKFWMNLKNSEPSQPESEESLSETNQRRSSQDQVKFNTKKSSRSRVLVFLQAQQERKERLLIAT